MDERNLEHANNLLASLRDADLAFANSLSEGIPLSDLPAKIVEYQQDYARRIALTVANLEATMLAIKDAAGIDEISYDPVKFIPSNSE